MRWRTYLRRGHVFIPAVGAVDKGLYRDVEPVAVLAVSDTEGLQQEFARAITRGNPPTPPYLPDAYPQPVVVKYAGVKSWGSFAQSASTWVIDERNGLYQIVGHRREPNNWVPDPKQTIVFPPGTKLEQVIDRMIAILQEAARAKR
jgi:hypothetical protein